MNKCEFICGAALCAAAGLWIGGAFAGPNGTENSVSALTYTRTALWPGFDGKYCKMCPSVATDGKGLAFMKYGMLLLTGSDVFCGSYISKSTDGGETWSQPRAVTEFPDTLEHGLRVTRSCGPRYNRTRDLWFGLGSAATYENDRVQFTTVVDGRPYGWPLCAKFDPKTGKFSEVAKIDFPLPYARVYPFGQMAELDNGDMLVPFNWEPLEKAQNKNDGYSVFGRIVIARCRVDQNGFRIVEVGKPIACDGLRRGVGEPSLIRLGKKFYLTLRSDEYGMWCASDDGLNFSAPKRWTWTDDGKEIGNRNTQQHWMKVGGKLYLAYTRVTPTNGHVFRNRAPVFLAEFDPSRGGLVRETEMPLVPERGARLGNFCCTEDGHGGSWLVTAEWMQPIGCEKYGSDNSIWFVKVSERPAAKRNRGVLLLTFDDALFHSWDKALPLFDRYGAHATFFVDGRGDERTNLMKMRTYRSYGHSVGFHSAGHVPAKPIVAEKGIDAWLKSQIEPQVVAAQKANLTVRNFAYPNSSRTDETDAALKPYFNRIRTGHLFNRDPATCPLATCDEAFISRDKLVSSHLLWGMGFSSKFPGIADDLEKGLERLAARNEALVLYSHDIKEKPDGDCHNTSLDVLERILSKARALGIEVIGFDEIGASRPSDLPYAVTWCGRAAEMFPARVSSYPFCRVWPGHQRDKSQTETAWCVRFDAPTDGVVSIRAPGIARRAVRLLPQKDAACLSMESPDELRLAVTRPGAYVLTVDGLPTLHVFADPPLAPIPAPGPGGRLIRFARGEHHPGVVAPKSGDVVVLDEGAVVYGSLFVLNATNVTVTGRGIFDGSRLERSDETMRAFRRARGLPEIDTESACFAYSVYGSENVKVSGVTFRDAPFWTFAIRNHCRGTLIDNIHIVGNWRYNSDGVDVCASADTVIRNSFIRTFDDCVIARGPYLKGENEPVDGLVVTNCDLFCDWGCAVKAQVQDFSGSTIQNVRVADCRILSCAGTAFFLAVRYGADRDIIRNFTAEDIDIDLYPQYSQQIQKSDDQSFAFSSRKDFPLVVAQSYTLGPNLDNQRNGPMKEPSYYHFTFENFAFRRFRMHGDKRSPWASFESVVPNHVIRNVVFEDMPDCDVRRKGNVEFSRWRAQAGYAVSDAEVFVDNRSRGRSGHMGHALIDCGQGRILAFNSNVPTNRCDGHSGYGWMEYRVSRDYGRTWDEPRVLDYSMKVFKEGKHTALCEKGVRAPDGRIILFFQITDATRPISCEPWSEPTWIESRDGGETWSDARVACSDRGRIYDAVVDRDSVYFLLPTSPNFCDTNQEYVVYKSTNGGPFVRHATSIDGAKKGYGAMAFAPDGSLVVYAYDSLDEAHPQYCVSRDRGETWEKPGRCTCANFIRNPQVRRIGDDWFMCGRNGKSWGNPGFGDGLVLYHSKNGIDWDEGVKIAKRPDGTGTGFYSCLLPIFEPGRPPRLLLQYSRPYWAQSVNVEHRWIEPRPVDVGLE